MLTGLKNKSDYFNKNCYIIIKGELYMFDIFGRKKIKRQEEYITRLEIKERQLCQQLDEMKKEYKELESKYKKVKMELFLIKGE